MTGAEHFAGMIARFEFAAIEIPSEMRLRVMSGWIAEGAVGLADRLIREHDYGGAHDVIIMASEMLRKFAIEMIAELDDDGRDVARTMMQRMAGVDVRLPKNLRGEAEDPEAAAAIDANALSAEELAALGLGFEDDLDVSVIPG